MPRANAPAPGRGALPAYRSLAYSSLRPFQPPAVQASQLPAGIKLYLSEDHDLPLISGTVLVRTGNVFDPPGKAGLAQLTGLVMRSGGTVARTGEQMDAALENLASRIEVNIGDTFAAISFSCLKEGQAETLALLRDLLTAPAFRTEKLEVAKAQIRAAIARRNDDPRQIIQRESAPYAGRPEFTTVDAIRRSDLEQFHKRYFFPANATLQVYGDFDAAQMKAQLEQLFAGWTASQPKVELPPAPAPSTGGVYVAVRNDLNRVWFALSLGAVDVKDKDAPAMEILAALLGGSPGARLGKRKLTATATQVDVAASWNGSLDRPAILEVAGAAPSTAIREIVQGVRDEAQALRTAEPADEEFKSARDAVLARLAFTLDTPAKMLGRMLMSEYYGYPREFPIDRQKQLAAVTRADVLRVAKERLDPSRMTLFAVADSADFAKQLEGLGTSPITVDIAIPPAKPGPAPSDTASLERGRELLRKVRQASGGEEKWAAIHDMTEVVTHVGSAAAGGGARTQTLRWIAPAILREENTLSSGRVIAYLNAGFGWVSNGRASGALVGPQLQQIQRDLFLLYPRLIASDTIQGRTANALDDQTVEIQEGSFLVRLMIDPSTGLPTRILHEATAVNDLPVAIEEELKEFREVDGVRMPHLIEIRQNGQKFAEAAVTDLKFNQGLKVEELQRRP